MSISGLLTDGIGSFGTISQIVLDGLFPNPFTGGTPTVYCNIGGVWKNLSAMTTTIGGAEKPVLSVYCKINDVWKIAE